MQRGLKFILLERVPFQADSGFSQPSTIVFKADFENVFELTNRVYYVEVWYGRTRKEYRDGDLRSFEAAALGDKSVLCTLKYSDRRYT